MLKKLLSKLTQNIGLKLLAMVFAIALWLLVVNTDDPKMTRRFTSSVTMENASYLSDQGIYYELADGSNTISFDVTAKRSYMDQLSSTDFRVVADLKNTELVADSDIATVPVEITALRYSTQVAVSGYAKKIQLSVDDLQKSQFIVSPQIAGTLGDGKELGTLTATPNLVTVSGPKAVVTEIDHIYAVVDVTGVTSDVTVACLPIAYNADGDVVDSGNISYNVSTVTVSLTVLDTKDVGIVCGYTGEPASGYNLREISVSPQTVTVKGKSQALNSITSINIPASALDISSARGDVTTTVDVAEYLPGGVVVSGDSKVTLNANIVEEASKALTLYVSNITVLNVPEGYDASIRETSAQVNISGLESDIEKVTSSTLTGTIDATGFQPGENRGKVSLDLSTGISYDNIYMSVTLTRKGESYDSETADESGSDTYNNAEESAGEEQAGEGEISDGSSDGASDDISGAADQTDSPGDNTGSTDEAGEEITE